MRSALCSAAISSGSAVSGVYTRPEKYGNFAGSPWMCVWQSQAPAGTSKFTGVAGWAALARPALAWTSNPPAIAPATNLRLVSMSSSMNQICGLEHCELERPGRDHLVLVEQRAAHRIAIFIFSFKAFKTTIASGGAGIGREDGVAAEDEAPAQRADRRVARSPVGRARERRERLDLVAVVLHARRVAAQPQHGLEQPARRLVADRGFSGRREFAAAGVAILALGAPGPFPE